MKIYILNTLELGVNSTDILKKHLEIDGVIGLSERDPTDKISGYIYLKQHCQENNFEFIEVEDYRLSSPKDKARLLKLDIDILIVSGWQRLIPEWLINHCKICVIGSHGSAREITGGRGRSPLNWALMLGMKEFYVSIFKIDKGIDSGVVLDTKKYALSELDDIRTANYKASWLTAHMIIKNIKNGQTSSNNFLNQKGEPRYLPQRLPKHGEIDWTRNSDEIYNFIRALTKPYPGAFNYVGKNKIIFWKGFPFEMKNYSDKFEQGEIVSIYANENFLVKTGDSFLLIQEYHIESEDHNFAIKEGTIFLSADFNTQIGEIVNAHYSKYPDLLISDDILRLNNKQ